MKIIAKIILLQLFLFSVLNLQASNITDRLTSIRGINRVESLKTEDSSEKFLFFIEQKLDPKSEQSEIFNQRVILKHRGFDRPTVIVTEGYWANYAVSPNYKEEISELIDANLIVVEYRYFGESIPNPCNWEYLTVENSLYDYHNIVSQFKTIYNGKWISTGISKGGQTTMFYRAYFPNDVDVSIPYVAPLNKAIEDGRHEQFINNISSLTEREKVQNFQIECLKRRDRIQSMFQDYCSSKDYIFRTSIDEIYDMSILEFSFSFWQNGFNINQIPQNNASDSVLFNYLLSACEPDYFSNKSPYTSFNVQAMRELGYYGYDIEPFKNYLSIKSAEGYMRRIMIPENLSYIEFKGDLYENVNNFLRENDVPMIYIYGEYDPWSATGVTWLKDKKYINVFVQPGGSHRARINTMPQSEKKNIYSLLESWLDIKIKH